MQKFTVLRPVTFRIGRFRLTDAQLARRKHVVRVVDGLAEPIAEVSFKAGEVIETDLDVPKGLHGKIEPIAIDAPAEVAFSVQEPVEAPGEKPRRATLKLGR